MTQVSTEALYTQALAAALLAVAAAALAAAACLLREKHQEAAAAVQNIQDQLDALDPATRAAVIARLTSDEVKRVRGNQPWSRWSPSATSPPAASAAATAGLAGWRCGRTQCRPDRSASWHDRRSPVRTWSPGVRSRSARWLPCWLPVIGSLSVRSFGSRDAMVLLNMAHA